MSSPSVPTPSISGTPVIDVEKITKHYGNTLALDEVSLKVGQNEAFALLGPNGAGKTTLLHILCSILQPDSGTDLNLLMQRLAQTVAQPA